jgi:hypothetical protein
MKIENKAVEGLLTYPRPAPLGCQSGRVIDEEHWRKVERRRHLRMRPQRRTDKVPRL